MTHRAPISQAMEDYLKAIYHLQAGREVVSAREIAGELGVSASSVTSMLRKLQALGLIRYSAYRPIRLTPAGERVALEVIRHHRLLELYLQEKLGYSLARVHEEADRLEHTISEELAERISAALGDPREDPHGSPIPARDGTMIERALMPLSEVETGRQVTVRQLLSRGSEHLRFLEAIGLLPGARVQVLEKRPLAGPLSLRIGSDRQEVIGRDLADRILVDPVDEEETQ